MVHSLCMPPPRKQVETARTGLWILPGALLANKTAGLLLPLVVQAVQGHIRADGAGDVLRKSPRPPCHSSEQMLQVNSAICLAVPNQRLKAHLGYK